MRPISAVFGLLALAVLTVTSACGPGHLRDDQAQQMKRFCISFSHRAGVPASVAARIEGQPLSDFRVGHGAIRGGVDLLHHC